MCLAAVNHTAANKGWSQSSGPSCTFQYLWASYGADMPWSMKTEQVAEVAPEVILTFLSWKILHLSLQPKRGPERLSCLIEKNMRVWCYYIKDVLRHPLQCCLLCQQSELSTISSSSTTSQALQLKSKKFGKIPSEKTASCFWCGKFKGRKAMAFLVHSVLSSVICFITQLVEDEDCISADDLLLGIE